MARLKTPIRLLKIHGSRRAKNRKELEIPIYKTLPEKPSHLQGDAAEFYHRAGNQLVKQKILTPLDIEAFILMAEEYGELRRADALCGDLTITTSNGDIIQNPAIGIRNRARDALKKSMVCFGMLPTKRGWLPVKIDDDKSDPFTELSRRGRKKK
jgi:P27 family predicted phage terminase small subunit